MSDPRVKWHCLSHHLGPQPNPTEQSFVETLVNSTRLQPGQQTSEELAIKEFKHSGSDAEERFKHYIGKLSRTCPRCYHGDVNQDYVTPSLGDLQHFYNDDFLVKLMIVSEFLWGNKVEALSLARIGA